MSQNYSFRTNACAVDNYIHNCMLHKLCSPFSARIYCLRFSVSVLIQGAVFSILTKMNLIFWKRSLKRTIPLFQNKFYLILTSSQPFAAEYRLLNELDFVKPQNMSHLIHFLGTFQIVPIHSKSFKDSKRFQSTQNHQE